MKKFFILLLALCLITPEAFAASGVSVNITVTQGAKKTSPLTTENFLIQSLNFLATQEGVPESSAYIELKFPNIRKGTKIYDALQRGVYMNFIRNTTSSVRLKGTATEDMLAALVKKVANRDISYTKWKAVTEERMLGVLSALYEQEAAINPEDDIREATGFALIQDAYTRLKNEYFDATKTIPDALIRGAVKGMTEATGDKHTTYFPPTESKNFQDDLSGEFEGIGAYLDMQTPGILKIVSPIVGSPAEKSGVKPGDIIEAIDGVMVTKETSLSDAVNRIKGKSGTSVKITVNRLGTKLDITVIRGKITIEYVTYKKSPQGVPMIAITMFGDGVAKAFSKAVETMIKDTPYSNNLIIDLRNNPGGSLEEVASILSYFVPAGEPVVKIHYRDSKGLIAASAVTNSLANRKIAILVNGGSASASEIMAGTIKDYLPATRIVGETTYGKGSVQSLVPYTDGSSLKYTIAKWFTGKTETGIDGVGIKPDMEIKFDEAMWKNGGSDNQLSNTEDIIR